MFKNALRMIGLAAIVAPAFAAEWMTDLDAARAKAAAEHKDVLVDFTGSDWCGWCIKLRKEVFDTPAFDAYAKDKFVLVEIDLPRTPGKISPEQMGKNQKLCEQYGVEGFPTIIVMNPQGAILGGFVGGKPNMEETAKALDAALANGKLMSQAAGLQGVEKAKALMEVYKAMPDDFGNARKALQGEIAALDSGNETGIQGEIAADKQMSGLYGQLSEAGGDMDKALGIVDKAIRTALPANVEAMKQIRAQILMGKVSVATQQAKTTDDVLAIKALLLQIADSIPHADQAAFRDRIEKEFADPAKVLKEIEEARTPSNAAKAERIKPGN